MPPRRVLSLANGNREEDAKILGIAEATLNRRLRECQNEQFLCPTSGLTPADAERKQILSALQETGWVLGCPKGAAARLGIKRSMLY